MSKPFSHLNREQKQLAGIVIKDFFHKSTKTPMYIFAQKGKHERVLSVENRRNKRSQVKTDKQEFEI